MANKPQSLTLPLLITRSLVVFPGNQQMVEAGREFSKNAINEARNQADSLIFLTSQKEFETESPTAQDVYEVGTLCHIISASEKENRLRVRVEVIERVKLDNISLDSNGNYYVANGTITSLGEISDEKNRAIIAAIDRLLESLPNIVSSMPKSTANLVARTSKADELCYAIAGFLPAPTDRKQEILEAKDYETLMNLVAVLINGENQKNQIEQEISQQVRESAEKSQKEYFLREKLKAIKKELGESTDAKDDPDAILEKLEKNPYPDFVKAKVKAELKKLDMMPGGSLEGALIQSYLDVLMNVPWWQKN